MKNNKEESQYGTTPIRESFGSSKARVSLSEKNEKKTLSDLQIVGFWASKNGSSVSAIAPRQEKDSGLASANVSTYYSLLQDHSEVE